MLFDPGISSEEFVASLTRQDDGHVVSGQFRHRIQRNRCEGGEWLVGVPDHVEEGAYELIGRKDDFVMVGAKAIRCLPRVAALVVAAARIEGDGKGLEPLDAQLAGTGHHGRRVESAAQQDTDGDVAHEVGFDRTGEVSVELLDSLLLVDGGVDVELKVPIALDVQSRLVDGAR